MTRQYDDGWEICPKCSEKVAVWEAPSGKYCRLKAHHTKGPGRVPRRKCSGSGHKIEVRPVSMAIFGSPYNLDHCNSALCDFFDLPKRDPKTKQPCPYVWSMYLAEILVGAAQLGVPFVISGNGSHLPKGAGAPLMYNIDDSDKYVIVSAADKLALQVCLAIGAYVERNFNWDGKILTRKNG